MYQLSEQQIDFILNDIRARGVEMESLQLNLLDHVCCIIEQNLEENGDFEGFYASTISTFYRYELCEIEEETIQLLTNKNYYAMKKAMIIIGTISAVLMSAGIAFKFQHWAGASFFLVLGISSFSLMFLPLVFLLKAKEKQQAKDKVVAGLGTLSGILLSMAILFKIMHWPGANAMGAGVLIVMGLVFLPIYFFSGIRHAETKVNTIVTSILVVAGCGLFLSLVRSPAGTRALNLADTRCFVRNETILKTEQRQVEKELKTAAINPAVLALSTKVDSMCQQLKETIVQGETGQKTIDADFESRKTLIGDRLVEIYFSGESGDKRLSDLEAVIEQYNQITARLANPNLQSLPVKTAILETGDKRVLSALNELIQMQMVVLQNERELAQAK
jgi:hypothetical protein